MRSYDSQFVTISPERHTKKKKKNMSLLFKYMRKGALTTFLSLYQNDIYLIEIAVTAVFLNEHKISLIIEEDLVWALVIEICYARHICSSLYTSIKLSPVKHLERINFYEVKKNAVLWKPIWTAALFAWNTKRQFHISNSVESMVIRQIIRTPLMM